MAIMIQTQWGALAAERFGGAAAGKTVEILASSHSNQVPAQNSLNRSIFTVSFSPRMTPAGRPIESNSR
jgi:hypothetical protein